MAVPDINHKVCMLCDHYDEKDCPYCGMGFEGFEIKKHEQQIKAEAEQEHAKMCESCIHKVSKEDIDAIRSDAIEKFNNKVDYLKEHYTDACNMCTKMECDVCAIDNIIEQLEQLKDENK